MNEVRKGFQDARAVCETCGAEWSSRNAHGVAVQHARKHKHAVSIETARHDFYDCTGAQDGK